MAKLATTIARQIDQFPDDVSFGYTQLAIAKEDYLTAAKALERLQKKGVVKKLAKGIFYKPKQTVFGEKKPDEQQRLKPYLYRNGRRTAYITGDYLYNQLGLTTQIPAVIKIASRDRRIYIDTETLKATAVKSYVDVTDENYELLGFLDALKDVKLIPDVSIRNALAMFKGRISELKPAQRQAIIDFALAYPPRVRALLGAILSDLKLKTGVNQLKESLNPLTAFDFGIDDTVLPTVSDWNIR